MFIRLTRLLIVLLLTAATIACSSGSGRNNNDGDNGDNDQNDSPDIQLQRVLPEMNFSQPLLFLPHPDEDDIFYVVQQNGVIWRADLTAGTRSEFVDLTDYYSLTTCSECGLLGMAFHPDFAANGHIYLSFTAGPSNDDMTSYVARFRSADNGETLAADLMNPDELERVPIFDVQQPFANHNGGHIVFGPDGLLYLGLGDGGSSNDPDGNAQNINTVLGAMLRLNDDGTAAAGNNVPGGLPELYAYGLRNPWRWSFDRQSGDLWLGDVGQDAFEEVDIIVNGGNYGWGCREGLQPTPGIGDCTITGGMHIDPVAVYSHSEGNSITGGYVYRGSELGDDYQGVYFFADFGSGRIWGLFPQGSAYERVQLLASDRNISSFGEDHNGELYVVDYGGGIYRIVGNDT